MHNEVEYLYVNSSSLRLRTVESIEQRARKVLKCNPNLKFKLKISRVEAEILRHPEWGDFKRLYLKPFYEIPLVIVDA